MLNNQRVNPLVVVLPKSHHWEVYRTWPLALLQLGPAKMFQLFSDLFGIFGLLDAKIMSVSVELHRGVVVASGASQRNPFLNLEEATLADGWKLNHGIFANFMGAKRPSFNMRNNMKQPLDELD